MISITERRRQLEEEVRKSGEGFINDIYIHYGPKPFWTLDSTDTHYDKQWGKQGKLSIDGFVLLPKSERFLNRFTISLWNKKINAIPLQF